MPPIVIDVAKAEDVRDVVHRTAAGARRGRAGRVADRDRLRAGRERQLLFGVGEAGVGEGRDTASPFVLAIKGADEAEDYSPGWSRLARRLARRCWPGPVTLVVDADDPASLTHRLPSGARDRVCPDGTVGLRAPANPVVQDVLRMLAGPIALTSANRSGEPEAVTVADVVKAVGDSVGLVLDDGPAHYGQPSTVVGVDGQNLSVLREGVVGQTTLERLSRYLVVMVCTGNTCRSPMAEALMREAVAKRIGVKPDELEEKGVVVASAGLAAASGSAPSREACVLMHERGLDLSQHAAQQLTDQLVRHADLLVTMTNGHRQAIVDHWPEAAPRTRLLLPDGRDLSDPIGGPLEVYRQCAELITQGVEAHADQVAAEVQEP